MRILDFALLYIKRGCLCIRQSGTDVFLVPKTVCVFPAQRFFVMQRFARRMTQVVLGTKHTCATLLAPENRLCNAQGAGTRYLYFLI